MSAADELRRLHRGPPLLVLPNAWDVASARAFAALPGCRAIATTSAAVARSLGFDDGEQAPVEEMLRVVERIATAVAVPVSADLEAGYGDPPRTAAGAVAAGAAGMNLEDSHGEKQLVGLDDQVELIRAVRAAAPDLVLNARVDVFISGAGGIDEAVERGNAYLAAGADCVYPIVAPWEAIAALVGGIGGPLNILVPVEEPRLDELEALGVARVTFGPRLATAALDEATRLAGAALARQLPGAR
ncbi:MAG TPA: isocitrate lyase/phosphoenolpyruvate mutase family protein [Gaiellaceae bacterium]|nr:isocitrate lyase/phosphoenolpyruvate mutase family protein [Gaiellaceae bacterium]